MSYDVTKTIEDIYSELMEGKYLYKIPVYATNDEGLDLKYYKISGFRKIKDGDNKDSIAFVLHEIDMFKLSDERQKKFNQEMNYPCNTFRQEIVENGKSDEIELYKKIIEKATKILTKNEIKLNFVTSCSPLLLEGTFDYIGVMEDTNEPKKYLVMLHILDFQNPEKKKFLKLIKKSVKETKSFSYRLAFGPVL